MTRWQFLGTAAVSALIVGAPVGYSAWSRTGYRNFHAVEPGRLYRSGQLNPDTFATVLREYQIGTVFSLRDTRDEQGVPADQWEEDYCRSVGVDFYRQPPADWSPVDGAIPGDANVAEFLTVLRNRRTKWPILVHCFAGVHRTGVHCAIYRIEFNGWPAKDALSELVAHGYSRKTFADNLLQYVGSYTRGRLPSKGEIPPR